MTLLASSSLARERREREFWDEHVPPLEQSLRELETGPDPNTRAILDRLEPLRGVSVLEVGCGSGVLSAWLARRGARVVGVDVSAASVERAVEVAQRLDLSIEFACDAFPSSVLEGRVFDRIAGRYVLHHLDLDAAVPALAAALAPGGRAAFLETMSTNPLLRLARRILVGRLGVPRYGTADERPLGRRDLAQLRAAIGPLEVVVAEMRFLRVLDRQILGYRRPALSRVLAGADDLILHAGLLGASYHQVLVLTRR